MTESSSLSVELVVPETTNDGESNEEIITEIKQKFCELFGGVTEIRARGSWIGPDSKLYDQQVVLLRSYLVGSDDHEVSRLTDLRNDVFSLAMQLCKFRGEKAVLLVYNGQAMLLRIE